METSENSPLTVGHILCRWSSASWRRPIVCERFAEVWKPAEASWIILEWNPLQPNPTCRTPMPIALRKCSAIFSICFWDTAMQLRHGMSFRFPRNFTVSTQRWLSFALKFFHGQPIGKPKGQSSSICCWITMVIFPCSLISPMEMFMR